ncbi:MAG: redox-sensing transcriptional repressor Rex [Gemmataceae bacterium]
MIVFTVFRPLTIWGTQMPPQGKLSARIIGRLALYRRLLKQMKDQKRTHVFSHELAERAGMTAAQVRRDVMTLGYLGSPARGYDIPQLMQCLAEFLGADAHSTDRAVLAGVGNLGQALVSYFGDQRFEVRLVGIFDTDLHKIGRTIHGHRCRALEELVQVVQQEKANVGIVAVPAEHAQEVGSLMAEAGVRGVLNFAPIPITLSNEVYVENVDLSVAMERVAFMARQSQENKDDPR